MSYTDSAYDLLTILSCRETLCLLFRFVVSGQKLFDGVSPGSVKVFLFDAAYDLDSTQVHSMSYLTRTILYSKLNFTQFAL